MKPLLFLLISLLFLQTASAQDYLPSKFRTFQEKVTIPLEHPAAKRTAGQEYYIGISNDVNGVCITNVTGLDDWNCPLVCYGEYGEGTYETPATTIKVDVDASAAYYIVLYINGYEWQRREAPQTYMQHVFYVGVLGGGFNVVISIEPFIEAYN